MYPLASKHHSSNEFPVLGPTVSPTGTRLAQAHWNLSHPHNVLEANWNKTDISNLQKYLTWCNLQPCLIDHRGPKELTGQRTRSVCPCAPCNQHWAGNVVRYSTNFFQYLLPTGSWSSLVNKQVLQVSQSQFVNFRGFFVTQRVVWWRSVVSPFTPEWTSHSTARERDGVGRAENLPSARWMKVLPVL